MVNIMKIDFKTAVIAKEKGFKLGTEKSYCQYHSSYTYDGDESHPESYKKDEIRPHNLFMVNCGAGDYSSKHYTLYEAPSQSQLQKWLREKHDIHIDIRRIYPMSYYNNYEPEYNPFIYLNNEENHVDDTLGDEFDTYEGAMERALLVALSYVNKPNE